MFLADFHMHSHFSDGTLSIPQLVDLLGQQGVGAIAVTDHLCEQKTFLGKSAKLLARTLTPYSFATYMQTLNIEAERAWRQYKMLVIPGVEITINSFSHKDSAHILALGVHDYIDPDLPIREIIRVVHAQGGLAIAAHPVNTGKAEHQTRKLWNEREEWQHHFDAWEVASGKRLFPEVQKSGLRMLANSDLHHSHQLESWKNVFDCEKNFGAIREAVLKQQIEFKYFRPRASQWAAGLNPATLKRATAT